MPFFLSRSHQATGWRRIRHAPPRLLSASAPDWKSVLSLLPWTPAQTAERRPFRSFSCFSWQRAFRPIIIAFRIRWGPLRRCSHKTSNSRGSRRLRPCRLIPPGRRFVASAEAV